MFIKAGHLEFTGNNFVPITKSNQKAQEDARKEIIPPPPPWIVSENPPPSNYSVMRLTGLPQDSSPPPFSKETLPSILDLLPSSPASDQEIAPMLQSPVRQALLDLLQENGTRDALERTIEAYPKSSPHFIILAKEMLNALSQPLQLRFGSKEDMQIFSIEPPCPVAAALVVLQCLECPSPDFQQDYMLSILTLLNLLEEAGALNSTFILTRSLKGPFNNVIGEQIKLCADSLVQLILKNHTNIKLPDRLLRERIEHNRGDLHVFYKGVDALYNKLLPGATDSNNEVDLSCLLRRQEELSNWLDEMSQQWASPDSLADRAWYETTIKKITELRMFLKWIYRNRPWPEAFGWLESQTWEVLLKAYQTTPSTSDKKHRKIPMTCKNPLKTLNKLNQQFRSTLRPTLDHYISAAAPVELEGPKIEKNLLYSMTMFLQDNWQIICQYHTDETHKSADLTHRFHYFVNKDQSCTSFTLGSAYHKKNYNLVSPCNSPRLMLLFLHLQAELNSSLNQNSKRQILHTTKQALSDLGLLQSKINLTREVNVKGLIFPELVCLSVDSFGELLATISGMPESWQAAQGQRAISQQIDEIEIIHEGAKSFASLFLPEWVNNFQGLQIDLNKLRCYEAGITWNIPANFGTQKGKNLGDFQRDAINQMGRYGAFVEAMCPPLIQTEAFYWAASVALESLLKNREVSAKQIQGQHPSSTSLSLKDFLGRASKRVHLFIPRTPRDERLPTDGEQRQKHRRIERGDDEEE